jgi:hypothetical protein
MSKCGLSNNFSLYVSLDVFTPTSTADLSQLLSPSRTLADYGLQEVTLVTRSRAPGMGSALSSSDIMALQREEDKRRQQARQQHGTGTGLSLVLNKRSQSVSVKNNLMLFSMLCILDLIDDLFRL